MNSISSNTRKNLKKELVKLDPWNLSSNPYEQKRYEIMLSMLGEECERSIGLEVGCAVGVFTDALAQRLKKLYVLDLMPEAISRTKLSTANKKNIIFSIGNVVDYQGFAEPLDLIVLAEVLYYLTSKHAIQQALNNATSWLRPGGILILGSVVDEVTERWGTYGAETAMRFLEAGFEIQSREKCVGSLPDEISLIVKFIKK